MQDEIDETFYEDSSSALGLDHRASYAAGYVPDGERALEREARQQLRDEMERQGVKERDRLEVSNAGAYDGFDLRVRALQAEGLCLVDATARATEDLRAGLIEGPPPDPTRAAERDYLGATVEELMRAPVDVAGKGSSKGRTREKPVRVDNASGYDAILADDSHGRSAFVGARVSAETKEALAGKSLEVSAGEIVERVVRAALTIGVGPRVVDELLAEMEARVRDRKAS